MITVSVVIACHQSCYHIIDYIPYVGFFIPMTDLFYNCKTAPLNPFYLFRPSSDPLLLSSTAPRSLLYSTYHNFYVF